MEVFWEPPVINPPAVVQPLTLNLVTPEEKRAAAIGTGVAFVLSAAALGWMWFHDLAATYALYTSRSFLIAVASSAALSVAMTWATRGR